MAILTQSQMTHTRVRIPRSTKVRGGSASSVCAPRWIRLCAALAIALRLPAPGLLQAEDPPSIDEYRVKAAFLYNFAKFVEWPGQAFKSPGEPFGICIAGANPFGTSLQDMVAGKMVSDRGFAVRIQPVAQFRPAGCHILFVSAAEVRHARALLEALKSESILTVGEGDEFAASGGMISFRMDANRVHIDIAAEAAARARLRISSKLLSLAEARK